jgi:hypothetical protein
MRIECVQCTTATGSVEGAREGCGNANDAAEVQGLANHQRESPTSRHPRSGRCVAEGPTCAVDLLELDLLELLVAANEMLTKRRARAPRRGSLDLALAS